jgi:ribosome-associated protein
VEALTVTSSVVIPGEELSWTAVRSGGPGGQNVNKVSTKVELRFDLPGSTAISEAAKARLVALAASRLDARGFVVIVADETRSQPRNLELAREKLAELVRAALVVPKRRRATKPSKAAKRRRVEGKRKAGEKKRTRGDKSWD